MDAIIGLVILFLIFIAPILVAGDIAKKKNRSVNKAQVIGLLFGWIGVFCLWMGLKTRDSETKQLY